jgi:hypothetical protein
MSLNPPLHQAGSPLDSNHVKRALKKCNQYRTNSLFHKTQKRAEAGDRLLNLIQPCELNGTNPFYYVNELQKHASGVVRFGAFQE